MHHSVKLNSSSELERISWVSYASSIGSIMYAMGCTRLNVTYALNMVSWYQGKSGLSRWTAVKIILKYLRNTKDILLVYDRELDLILKRYSDATFQSDRDDSKSWYRWVFIMNGGVVT